MRKTLWPGCSDERHSVEMNEQVNFRDRAVFVIDRSNGKLGGFVEASIRPRVEGGASARVASLDALYVDPDLRRQGCARELLAAVERWAATRGMTEIASDVDVHDHDSIAIHRALGFNEASRLIRFLKSVR